LRSGSSTFEESTVLLLTTPVADRLRVDGVDAPEEAKIVALVKKAAVLPG
jgi:hypothetical protein